jgi:hypothetical protein
MKTLSILFLLVFATVLYAEEQTIAIPKHPNDATFARNATGRFYVSASSTDGGYLTYQWYCSGPFADSFDDPNGTDKNTIVDAGQKIEDGTDATLTITMPDVAGYYYYWVVITDHAVGKSDVSSLASAIARAKVVDRSLFPALQLGDMEGSVTGVTGGIGVRAITLYTGWPKVNGEWRWNSTSWEHAGGNGSDNSPAVGLNNVVGKAFDPQPHGTWGVPATVTTMVFHTVPVQKPATIRTSLRYSHS